MNQQKSYQTHQTGSLYLIPTPIGNLEDMTFRSVRMLKEADLIASEDTRNTQKLLNHFDIQTPQISFHEHNYQERIPQLLEKLKSGISIAQVSDAGMPSISDPGAELVAACISENIPVISLPGATAGLTALIASGLAPQPFFFYGFLPRKKKEQQEVLKELNNRTETMIFYESPYRVLKTLENMQIVYGEIRKVVLCRELTKLHEEYLRGTLAELITTLQAREIKGECCLLVEGQTAIEQTENEWAEFSLKEHVDDLMSQEELSAKEAIKKVAKLRALPKQEVYKAYHELD